MTNLPSCGLFWVWIWFILLCAGGARDFLEDQSIRTIFSWISLVSHALKRYPDHISEPNPAHLTCSVIGTDYLSDVADSVSCGTPAVD